ncbi:MAG: phage major capsid protein [Candidatus Marinimicrobia bacterium]|jgi:hypothetical protein|nr:phage major capsid protein [Candidatus Neomarinimicrobiota bacterium]
MPAAHTKTEVTRMMSDVEIATKEHLIPVAVNQILNSNIIMKRLHKRSRPWSDGKRISFNLKYGAGEVKEKTTGYEEIVVQIFDSFEKGYIGGQYLEAAYGINGLDVDVFNTSRMQFLNLTLEKVETMRDDFKKKHSEMLFRSSGSDVSRYPSFKDMFTTLTTSQEICEIAPDDLEIGSTGEYAFDWLPEVYDHTTAAPTYANLTDPTSTYFIERMLKKAISNIGEKTGHKPTLIICTAHVWDAYDEVLTDRQIATHAEKRYDGGYDIIKLRGVDIVADSWVEGGFQQPGATATCYIINENFLQLFHAPKLNHKWIPWEQMETQYVYRTMMRHFGGIAPTRRDVHGSIIGLPSEHTS